MARLAHEPAVLLGAWLVAAAVSAIRPLGGYGVWLLEVGPVWIALAILIPTRRRFPLTPLAYRLIFVHACVLTLGAHYTYAEVPLGEWLRDWGGFQRNHYDRIGHLAQGFFPALIVREVLLRRSPLERGRWLFFLVTSVCLAFSALYELFEWWVAVAYQGGGVGEDFLGSQGDPWDAQWDMFLCLLGALLGQATLARLHDRQLEFLGASAADDE